MSTKSVCGLMVIACLGSVPLSAQETAAPRPIDQNELRHQIYVMEGALARAVEFGAQKLNRELRSVMPDVFMLAGDAQARGVYLEGYGIFFDVEVPMLRQSMMWSLRQMLDQDTTGAKTSADELRRYLQTSVPDPATRASLESALRRLEAQATPARSGPLAAPVGERGPPGAATVALPGPAPAAPPTSAIRDPNAAYTEAVQRALVDAMLDYSLPMPIGADEWLTVAARDNERRDSLAPQDPLEEVVTVLLRIKGTDLVAYRAGKIDKDEARRRVQIKEF